MLLILTYEKTLENLSMPRLNYDRMVQNISETNDYDMIIYGPEEYWKQMNEGHGMYRYFNLDNPDIYFNENFLIYMNAFILFEKPIRLAFQKALFCFCAINTFYI